MESMIYPEPKIRIQIFRVLICLNFYDTVVIEFFLHISDLERAIDIIELSFRFIDQDVRHNREGYFRPSVSPMMQSVN